jgi:8-oxo-dGTP pyrophosphatase MutT (NUDIX family)
MKLVYEYKNFIKIFKFNKKNKFINVKNFHRIELNDAVMVICENDNKILFIKEYRIGLKKMSWGLPGGFIEKKESPKQTAIRELKEETNIKIENIKLFKKFSRNGNYNCGIDYVFFSKVKKKNLKFEKNVKHIWLDKKNIKKYLRQNKFETPGVIAAVFYYLSTNYQP